MNYYSVTFVEPLEIILLLLPSSQLGFTILMFSCYKETCN
jgi:hypothetical protein